VQKHLPPIFVRQIIGLTILYKKLTIVFTEQTPTKNIIHLECVSLHMHSQHPRPPDRLQILELEPRRTLGRHMLAQARKQGSGQRQAVADPAELKLEHFLGGGLNENGGVQLGAWLDVEPHWHILAIHAERKDAD
jgi:hypothetical protein